MAMVNVM